MKRNFKFALVGAYFLLGGYFIMMEVTNSEQSSLFSKNKEALALEDGNAQDKGTLYYRDLPNGTTQYCCKRDSDRECGAADCPGSGNN